MTYKHFRADGSEINLHDTEDKQRWIKIGTNGEDEFLILCREKNILPTLQLNPDRKGNRIVEPEYIFTDTKRLADLKAQKTPFFTAGSYYNIPPRYAITININDINDIRTKYPDCILIFWIRWDAVRFESYRNDKIEPYVIEVDPLEGVWQATPEEIYKIINNAPIHNYRRRQQDIRGNAKASYCLDVRMLNSIWINNDYSKIDLIK